MMRLLLLPALSLGPLGPLGALGHSYLALPPSRNLLANLAGQESCPHCLQSGGPDNVKERGGGVWPSRTAPGSHGLCGDPVQGQSNPLRLADETYLKAGAVTSTYAPGQVVEFQIAVSTHHQGHYEFRICNKPLDGTSLTSAAEGQACLDQWLLERAPPLDDCVVNDARGDCQPLDAKHPERWYLPPAGSQTQVADENFTDSMAPRYPSSAEVHRMRYKIPDDLQCSRCTLQWYWSSGNSCYYDGDYFDYFRGIAALGWDAAAWQPQVLEEWANCANSCCQTNGAFGEEFWNCADVAVLPNGAGTTSSQPPASTTATTSTTTTTTTAITTTRMSTSDFSPVDGGVGRACRGRSAGDNSAAYYSVYSGVTSLEDCKDKCVSTMECVGVEYNSGGRCEVWTRPEGVQASIALSGYTCLRLGLPPSTTTTTRPVLGAFEPVDGGQNRACRGASSGDNSPGHYSVFRGLGSLDECKVHCAIEDACVGIEYSRMRCEVWTRAAGIEATAAVTGFSCYRYTPPGATSTSAPTGCSKAWAACGGRNHDGATCCENGYVCVEESVWYSQCRPAASLAEMPGLGAGTIKRRFRGSSFIQEDTVVDHVEHVVADEEL